jgi:Recombination endonuclease VII
MRGFWVCRRRVDGRLCMERNPNRKQLCAKCGGRKPQKRRPKHMAALELPYEVYLEMNDGQDRCAICLRERTEKDKRLHRDHDHRTGRARGLLCFPCNKRLSYDVTPEWLRAAADYLEKAREAA